MIMFYVIMCGNIFKIVMLHNHQCEMINISIYSWGVWCENLNGYNVQDWLMRTNTFGIVIMSIEDLFDYKISLIHLQEEKTKIE